MEYFGDPWGSPRPAPICDPDDEASVPQAPTPVGKLCVECQVPIKEGDQGVQFPYHWNSGLVTNEPHHVRCFLRLTWAGGIEPPFACP